MLVSYEQIVQKIIKEQEKVIGPLAVDQAKKVHGINVDASNQSITLDGDKMEVVQDLVKQYENLFGKIAIEVCKEALKSMNLQKNELPSILQ